MNDTLFPLPPPAPSMKARLHAFCEANGIRTHTTHEKADSETWPWVAVKVPSHRLDNGNPIGNMSLADMFAHFARLLDEGGYTGYGRTEREVVEALCEERKITFHP